MYVELVRKELPQQQVSFRFLDHEKSKLQQQSRINWLTQGDKDTKFFHVAVISLRSACIRKVTMSDGTTSEIVRHQRADS